MSRDLTEWSCRESNPGPPTPSQGFYERIPQSDLGNYRLADGAAVAQLE
jgi:hypothetical protein